MNVTIKIITKRNTRLLRIGIKKSGINVRKTKSSKFIISNAAQKGIYE